MRELQVKNNFNLSSMFGQWNSLCIPYFMETSTYHLVASHGMDVIIVPELDCRLVVIEKYDYSPMDDDLVLFAVIGVRSLVFRAIRYEYEDMSPLHAAIRWYANRLHYPLISLSA